MDLPHEAVEPVAAGPAHLRGAREHLEVARGLHQLQHVVAALHEHVQRREARVVPGGPRRVGPGVDQVQAAGAVRQVAALAVQLVGTRREALVVQFAVPYDTAAVETKTRAEEI